MKSVVFTPPTKATAQNQFVRGTTNPAVFYVQDGVARPLPDAATVKYMTNGQTVTTLTDVAMAAMKKGTPMPSLADGNLLTAYAPGTAVAALFMQGGLGRPVPDLATITDLQNGGAPSLSLSPTDFAAVPRGAAMPTRADGAVYQGDGKSIYAYLLKGGLKQPVPDATTLRDAGHLPASIVTIAAADLAAIPNGDPLPSTCKFLTPPPASIPLLLLPVRLETCFQGSELWLRVYPDDIHVNSFEPELTPDESTARAAFLAQAAAGGQAAQDAFTLLAQQYGPERAAWIASANAQPGNKAAQWTSAPSTNLLPERWIVMGYQAGASDQVLVIGPPIADSLPLGPDPNGPSPSGDPGSLWLTDFDSAIAAGMGFKIPLTAAQLQAGFTRIAVFGLRSQLAPSDAVARFSDLLQAHHYTDGLELLPHNAPTNNTDTTSSALSSRDPNYAKLYAVEQGPALCPSRPTADGDRLARALGIDPSLLAHVSGADAGQDEEAAAINTVSWPATWGYFLEQIVTGAVPNPDTILPLARDHFIAHVRARGHFPILRVGSQPYGILPMLSVGQWASLEGRALDEPLMSLLLQMMGTWDDSIHNVPQIRTATDPEAALVSLLGMTPSSASYITRSVIGPEYNLSYWRFIQQDPGIAWWQSLNKKAVAEAGSLAPVMATTRLANATFTDVQHPMTDIVVGPAPLDGLPAPDYVNALFSCTTWQQLRDFAMPARPVPLLLLLLRHAALRQYLDTAGELLAKTNAVQPQERLEPELLGLTAGVARPTAWDLLNRPYADKGPVGAYLDTARTDTTLPVFAAFWAAFQKLTTLSAQALDYATREALDLASYRLDAWFTSMAHFRLDQQRAAAPSAGVILGGYGFLENVVPQTAVASAGYIHAPSLAHSTTAAVLRSAYLTHQGAAQSPLQVNLSSDRVRLGLHLLDGIREGQTLGALLGYRLERWMHDNNMAPTIETLRQIAPLNNPDPATTPSESVAANNTIDGLALLAKIFPGGVLATGFGLPTDPTIRKNLTTGLQILNDAMDSVADLTLSESVHQLLNGNTVRAGATLDAIARGDVPPPEFDVVQTPRAGTAFTHRLFAIAPGTSAPGWTTTARAQAEPRLNAWAAAMLGSPARVHARASFTDSSGTVTGVEFGLDALALSPLDLLALPESAGLTGELGDRLLRAATAARPATVSVAATVSLVEDRDPAWTPDIVAVPEFLTLLWAVSRLASGARALTPQDLVAQGDTPGSIDNAELQARADAAEAQLRAASTALQATTALDTALLTAAGFGVANAIPALDATQWSAQASSAAADIAARIAALDKLATGFTRAGASSDGQRDHDVSRLTTIFGATFIVLPALDANLTAAWPQMWGNSAALQGGDTMASTTWMQRMARIRPALGRLDTALLYAEALAGRTLTNLQVAQLPVIPADRWIALAQTTNNATSRLSLVALSPQSAAPGGAIAGLILDEWVEVLPSAQQITGITFNHNDPTARAPQAILLGVRPDDFPEWTLESVEGTVLGAYYFATLRTVDPDALNSFGHFLPALYFAYNAGGPQVDAVSTDFTLAHAAINATGNTARTS